MKECLLIVSLLLAHNASATETGAEFLNIDADARAVSMGSAYTAMAEGINSIAYNPAGLVALNSPEASFSHTLWLMDSRHDFVGFGLPLGGKKANGADNKAISGWSGGIGLIRLSNSEIEVRNTDRTPGGSFSSYDQAVSLGVAKRISARADWRVGVAAKYIESSIAGEKASAVAADFGVSRAFRRLPVTLGLAIRNFGTPMRFISQKDPLPLALAGGCSVEIVPGFKAAADLSRTIYDGRTTMSFGGEYSILSSVSLRSGYMLGRDLQNKLAGIKGNFSTGAGLKFWGMSMDYAMQLYGELGNTQKLTVCKKF